MSSHSLFFRPTLVRSVLLVSGLLTGAAPTSAKASPNPVIEWATIVQPAIHSATAPRSAGTSQILHTMAMLAVYDAVMAIEGGYRPYAAHIDAPPGADVRAAVATAAYLTVRPRVAPAQLGYIDQAYSAYMTAIPDGPAKSDGASVGQQAAEAMLARRANDGFTAVGQIAPFTLRSAAVFRPAGPAPFESRTYTRDFIETRDYGRADSAIRTADQTDVAYFWSEHPYVHWNRNLASLAERRKLNVRKAARFFALVHTAASDAVIAGFEAKYHYRSWRPRTAIPQADADGNAYTDADATWLPLLMVNHPEYPSGHGFWSTAVVGAVAAFFGTTRVDWTIVTSRTAVPKLVVAERRYGNLGHLLGEIGDARVWGGLHWRHAINDGAVIGGRVAAHVSLNYFRPTRR